jgi:hypothetical protein
LFLKQPNLFVNTILKKSRVNSAISAGLLSFDQSFDSSDFSALRLVLFFFQSLSVIFSIYYLGGKIDPIFSKKSIKIF